MTHTMEFRGVPFQVVEGSTHPAYSLATFRPDGEEYDFRDKFWRIQPGDVVVDAGASYGAYTLSALAAGASKVWAFEPELTVLVDLRRNIAANGWEGRAKAYGVALWDMPDTTVHMSEYGPHWPPQTISGRYPCVTLDMITREGDELGRLDHLKLDVEGAEVQALRGALKTIERFKPRLIVEAHNFLDPELANKCKALLPGYSWQDVPRGDVVMLIGEVR